MIALQHALLLGVEIEAVGLAHERVDAAEQAFVGVDPVPVAASCGAISRSISSSAASLWAPTSR